MFNIEASSDLKGMLNIFLQHASRINEKQPVKYKYPLSMATFGVEEILQALDSMCSFRTTMWEKTRKYEEAFAKEIGSKYAVMVNSGSAADLLVMAQIKHWQQSVRSQSNKVIIPIVTWPTHLWALYWTGFTPKFVDVNPETLQMDIEQIKDAIDDDVCAVFPAHLMGNCTDMEELSHLCYDRELWLFEDCCEAQGTLYCKKKLGTFGVSGTYSFFFSHHLMCGEGGMIVTDEQDVYEDLVAMRSHGWSRNNKGLAIEYDLDPRYIFTHPGFNMRPTELQAAFGLEQIKKCKKFEVQRCLLYNKVVSTIEQDSVLGENFELMKLNTNAHVVPFAIPVRCKQKNKAIVMTKLEELGIETRPLVAGNLQKQPFANLSQFKEWFKGDFPGADRIHNEWIYVGLNPMFNDNHISILLQGLKETCE